MDITQTPFASFGTRPPKVENEGLAHLANRPSEPYRPPLPPPAWRALVAAAIARAPAFPERLIPVEHLTGAALAQFENSIRFALAPRNRQDLFAETRTNARALDASADRIVLEVQLPESDHADEGDLTASLRQVSHCLLLEDALALALDPGGTGDEWTRRHKLLEDKRRAEHTASKAAREGFEASQAARSETARRNVRWAQLDPLARVALDAAGKVPLGSPARTALVAFAEAAQHTKGGTRDGGVSAPDLLAVLERLAQ